MNMYLNRLGLAVLGLGLVCTTATATEHAVPCDTDQASQNASTAAPANKPHNRWRYPFEAKKQRAQGTVTIRVELDAEGNAQQVRLANSSGSSALDRAALTAAKSERFCRLEAPTEAVSGLAEVAVTYSLNKAVARL